MLLPCLNDMRTTVYLLCTLSLLVDGCASEKNKPVVQRGWIGGEYAVARAPGFITSMSWNAGVVGTLPKPLQPIRIAAIQVRRLETNTPAAFAGLRKNDFILEINHQPAANLQDFRRIIDYSTPGSRLALKFYRDGVTNNCDVVVGCEKFKRGGVFTVCFPTVVHGWDLWPNPGFSLVFLGLGTNPGLRHDLNHDTHEVYDVDWNAYLIFFEVSYGKRIIAQQPAPGGKG
jgi:hypothetical protein